MLTLGQTILDGGSQVGGKTDKVTITVGGKEITVDIPSPEELTRNMVATEVRLRGEKKVREKGRAHGVDTVLTGQMVYCVRDVTEKIAHFVAGIGATEQLVDMLLEDGHELIEQTTPKGAMFSWRIVAGPQVTFDYYWEPTEQFTKAVIHEGVRFTKTLVNKEKIRIHILKVGAEEVKDTDSDGKPDKVKFGRWEHAAWKEVQIINLLKKQGYKEPIRLGKESVMDFLLSANLVPKGMEHGRLAEDLLKAIAGILADYSTFQYPDSPNLMGDSDEMMAYLEYDKLLASLPVPIPADVPYYELVDRITRNLAMVA